MEKKPGFLSTTVVSLALMGLAFPIAVLFAIFSSIIWLIILGEWKLIVFGIVAVIVGPSLCGLLLMPGMLLVMPGVAFIQKDGILKILGVFFSLTGLAWTFVIMVGWSLFSFLYFISQSSHHSLIPLTIWAAGIAITPWIFMASKETDNEETLVTINYFGFALLYTVIMLGFELTSVKNALLGFIFIMVIRYMITAIRMIIAVMAESKQKADYSNFQ